MQVMAGVVETPDPLCSDRHDVLDADAEPPGEIDPGLDGKAHARNELLLFTFDDVRRLVCGDPDAMAGAMDEPFAVPGLRDHPSRRPVDVLARHARPYRIDRRLLRSPHDLVHLAYLGRRLTDRHGAGGVRAVAEHESPEVQHDRVPGLYHPVSGLVVGVGAVGTRPHDSEV